jgi:hypothetical protein
MVIVIWLLQDRLTRPWALAAGWLAVISAVGLVYRLGLGRPRPVVETMD